MSSRGSIDGRRPVVGISTYAVYAEWVSWKADSLLTPRAYVDKLAEAGALPVLLPPHLADQGEVSRIVDMVDALVLIGGEDVCGTWSARGDESPDEHARHSVERDTFEVALAQAAWAVDLPLLGICRGAQVLNVSRGGSLINDLVTAGASDIHRKVVGQFHEHAVEFRADVEYRGAYDPSALVPSHHHQAIDTVGDGLAVVGLAEDGVIEVVEAVDRSFIVGVQWHPEESSYDPIFSALVTAASRRIADPSTPRTMDTSAR